MPSILMALLEEAGFDGLTHAQITQRLTDVAANTLATYLGVMSSSGELERYGDTYRAGNPAVAAANKAWPDPICKMCKAAHMRRRTVRH
ncbi:hypothetical protein [Methylobacterium pseudosasicola]|uniref:hypothetical protein n=1 Tax=Methylobacterium pseudosasicola TaxID=582667 RepID=UPI000B81AA9E